MACLTAEGSLTDSGRRILAALARPSTGEDVAQAASLPLYRVRGALRELTAAGLVAHMGDRFVATELGRHRSEAGPGRADQRAGSPSPSAIVNRR